MMKLEVSGLDAFAKQGEGAARSVKVAVDSRAADGAERIADVMRGRVAVDRGTLRSTIRTEAADDGSALIRAGGTAETMKPIRGGGVFDEALAVEYGNARIQAEPFFYDSFEAQRDGVESEMGTAADGAAEKAFA